MYSKVLNQYRYISQISYPVLRYLIYNISWMLLKFPYNQYDMLDFADSNIIDNEPMPITILIF